MATTVRGAGRTGDARIVSRGGRAGNTLIILLVLLAIAAILAALLIPAIMNARRQAKRAMCASQLKMVGLALHMYAGDYQERFPESLEELSELGYLPAEEILQCPARKDRAPGEIDYVYVKGLSPGSRPNEPVAFDRRGNHRDGRNVLFVDGHVEILREAEFQRLYGQLDDPGETE